MCQLNTGNGTWPNTLLVPTPRDGAPFLVISVAARHNNTLDAMTIERTTPMGLWRHSKEFFDAAHVVLNAAGSSVSLPVYYLFGHSIELSLKAFLAARGVSLADLKSRKFGHDLNALLIEARKRRLGLQVKLSRIDVEVIKLLNFDYVAKRFEYRETGVYHLPLINLAEDVTHKLVKGLKNYCETNTLSSKPSRSDQA